MNDSKFEIYNYHEFLVYDTLTRQNKNYDITAEYKDLIDSPRKPDLYAPKGIPSLNCDGPTFIEVKKMLSYATMKDWDTWYNIYGKEFNLVLVYFETKLTPKPKESKDKGKRYLYVSYKELKGKKGKIGSPEDFYLKRAKRKTWDKEREDIINEAKDVVRQNNNVLFLGAGVSMSANMPSWGELLKGLMSEAKRMKLGTIDAFKELHSHILDECGGSYLIMARYLQEAAETKNGSQTFSNLIQKYLYSKEHSSKLLEILATIIQQKKTAEVITYNFDNILEQELEKRGLIDSEDYKSISKDAEIKGHNILPIYHVHGIIPETGSAEIVVFSEEEYHKRYANPFHWSNIEQLHALSRKHCFFIGLSMTDPNLRRLLDAAREINKTDRENHYAFLRRTPQQDYCLSNINMTCKYIHVSESLIDKSKQAEIYNFNYLIIENIFRDLGVRVIWYEDYNELPDLINKVFDLSSRENNKDLIAHARKKIESLKEIEEDIPKFNAVNMGLQNLISTIKYSEKNKGKYKQLVIDVRSILNNLISRIRIESIQDKMRIQNNIPTYNNEISGYAELFERWLSSIENILKNDES